MRRLGVIMESDPSNPHEAEGVLNPAVARGPDGHLYLLPRLVAAGNYSRIGLARVLTDRRGVPKGVERLGVVLEPREHYERFGEAGGVEDPRITYLAARRLYVMTYTAFGAAGPRIALAIGRDLVHWRRLGLARFAPHAGMDMGGVHNKDALLFPEPVPAPDGRPALALIHRPIFHSRPAWLREPRPSMWISYAPLDDLLASRHVVFGQHHLLAAPMRRWEHLRVGGGTPPLRTPHGWLVLYHGAAGNAGDGLTPKRVRYSAGMLLLDPRDLRRVLYRSERSILRPRSAAERDGLVPRVVFPQGLDVRDDGVVDVYYGMADSRIGVARTTLAYLLASAPALDPWPDLAAAGEQDGDAA